MGEEREHWSHNTGGPGLDLVPVAVQSHGPVAVWRYKKTKKQKKQKKISIAESIFISNPNFPFWLDSFAILDLKVLKLRLLFPDRME